MVHQQFIFKCNIGVLSSWFRSLQFITPIGFIARDLGAPTLSDWYVFGLTCEKDEQVKLQKLRVMMIKQQVLEQLGQGKRINLEQSHHTVRYILEKIPMNLLRVKTLQKMAEMWKEQKSGRLKHLWRVELCYPKHHIELVDPKHNVYL